MTNNVGDGDSEPGAKFFKGWERMTKCSLRTAAWKRVGGVV